jgi:hypothetical protein
MGTRHLRAAAVVTSAVLLMFVANAAEAQKKFQFQITLISPAASVVITQNDMTTGCGLDPTRGYGFRIIFDWSSKPLKNGSTYTLRLQHVGSSLPILVEGLTSATYNFLDCNGFIIDSNLSNWYWQVSHVMADGTVSKVSVQRPFSFAPCRLSTGEACNAPGP